MGLFKRKTESEPMLAALGLQGADVDLLTQVAARLDQVRNEGVYFELRKSFGDFEHETSRSVVLHAGLAFKGFRNEAVVTEFIGESLSPMANRYVVDGEPPRAAYFDLARQLHAVVVGLARTEIPAFRSHAATMAALLDRAGEPCGSDTETILLGLYAGVADPFALPGLSPKASGWLRDRLGEQG